MVNILIKLGITVLVLFFFSLPISEYIKSRNLLRESVRKSIFNKYHSARWQRMEWKKDHVDFFDFNHPDYQRLWEIEIGAEDLYLLHLNGIYSGASWSDYQFEKRKFEQENSN